MTPSTFLDNLHQEKIRVVETGCASTRLIARWIRNHPASKFDSVDLNGGLQMAIHGELESEGLSPYCTFHTQEPIKFLNGLTWLDAAFLNPSSLQDGEHQFSLALSAGAQLIVFMDFQHKAALAVRRAQQLGWDFKQYGAYSVLRRPIVNGNVHGPSSEGSSSRS